MNGEITINLIRRDAPLWKKDGDFAWALRTLDLNQREIERFVDGFSLCQWDFVDGTWTLRSENWSWHQWQKYLREKQKTFLKYWHRIERQEEDLIMLVDQLYAEKKGVRLFTIEDSGIPKRRKMTAHAIYDYYAKGKYGHWSDKGDILVEVALSDLFDGLKSFHLVSCGTCGKIFKHKDQGRRSLFCGKSCAYRAAYLRKKTS